MTYPLRIRGAVLDSARCAPPYAESSPLTISDLQLGAPGPGEVLVQILSAGLCHSDLSVVNGSRPRPLPMLLGHEAAGRVLDAGQDVADLVSGDLVVLTFLPRCGACEGCDSGGIRPCTPGSAANGAGTLFGGGSRITRGGRPVAHHLGVSAFATHAIVDRRSVVKVGSDVPPDIAALLGCAVLTGGGALINARRPSAKDSVAIVGLGGVGMAALLTACALGVDEIFAVDVVEDKRSLALHLGATKAYSPDDAVALGVTADIVIEAAGHPAAFQTAFDITAPGGTTVTVGLPSPDARISLAPLTLTAEARTIVGSYLGSSVPHRDIPYFEALWREGRLNLEPLISAHIRLDDINEALDRLHRGEAMRQMVVFS